MHPGAPFHHHLEWPARGARVRGPVLWLRGWATGRPGGACCDVRARTAGAVHLGVLGLPRTDLAVHFPSARPWLPAEFVIGVPVSEGAAEILLEVQDDFGAWHRLETLTVTVAPDGEPSPHEVGRVEMRPGGSWTVRPAHLPFHGHLDDPAADSALENGRVGIFGWLLHETLAIRTVWATADLRFFQELNHGGTDEALAAQLPALARARHARLRGAADLPPTLTEPACLRIYAELADGSVHLCLTQRVAAKHASAVAPVPVAARPLLASTELPALPSGRPRRLLLCMLSLQPDDSTWRALDLARHLTAGSRWSARLLATEDGPLRNEFESAGVPVQIVNPQPLFSAATQAAADSALAALGRGIWFKHLDAVAVFDPPCWWAVLLGRQHGLPVLVDGSGDVPMAVPKFFNPAKFAASGFVFASPAAAERNADPCADVPVAFIPPWHSAKLPDRLLADPGGRHRLIVPVRGTAEHGASTLLLAADWLTRHDPEFAAQHRLVLTALRESPAESLLMRDVILNQPALMAIEPSDPTGAAAACVCPAFSGHPIRALLDAAATGLPIVTTESPAMREIFGPHEVAFAAAGNPLALAHALVDLAANPVSARRRAAAAQRRVLAHHAPLPLLARWQAALESVVAAAR